MSTNYTVFKKFSVDSTHQYILIFAYFKFTKYTNNWQLSIIKLNRPPVDGIITILINRDNCNGTNIFVKENDRYIYSGGDKNYQRFDINIGKSNVINFSIETINMIKKTVKVIKRPLIIFDANTDKPAEEPGAPGSPNYNCMNQQISWICSNLYNCEACGSYNIWLSSLDMSVEWCRFFELDNGIFSIEIDFITRAIIYADISKIPRMPLFSSFTCLPQQSFTFT